MFIKISLCVITFYHTMILVLIKCLSIRILLTISREDCWGCSLYTTVEGIIFSLYYLSLFISILLHTII